MMKKPVIDLVAGARPNFMKIAPLHHALSRPDSPLATRLVHTGQHYDKMLSDIFFKEFDLPAPDHHLGVDGGAPADQTGRIMQAYDKLLGTDPPDLTLVVGDVNSTAACGLAAAHRQIPLVHLEAGLRSFDWSMPEEINRVVTDRVADLLLTPSADAGENLRREGIPEDRIKFVGNIMIDSLDALLPRARKSDVLGRFGLQKGSFALVTLHRPGNVDTPEKLSELLLTLAEVSSRMPVLLPAHPRLKKNIAALDARVRGQIEAAEALRLVEPLGYVDFVALEANARCVLTDSGGVQEETTVLGVPCLTLRQNTERPVTVTAGTNRVVAGGRKQIVNALDEVLALPMPAEKRPPLWDGKTAERVVNELTAFFERAAEMPRTRQNTEPVRSFVIPACEAHRSPEVRRELLLVAETGDWQSGPSAREIAERIAAYAGGQHVVVCADVAGALAALRADLTSGSVAVLGGWVPADIASVLNGSAKNWSSLETALPEGCRLVYVPPVTPGRWKAPQPDDVLRWAAEHSECIVAVDERWYEYTQETVVARVHQVPNVIALRSLGPAFGLDGLNIGYLIAAPKVVAHTAEAAAQSGVLPVALRAAGAALLDQGYMKEYVETRSATRSWLAGKLEKAGYTAAELPGPCLYVEGVMPESLQSSCCAGATQGGWLWAIGTPEQVEDSLGTLLRTADEVMS